MTLREIAREHQDFLREGIGWLIVYKTGRSWNCGTIYLDDNNMVEMDNVSYVEDVLRIDEYAICINEYYCAHLGELTIQEICDGIRYMYDHCWNLLSDRIVAEEGNPYNDESPETELIDRIMAERDVSVAEASHMADLIAREYDEDAFYEEAMDYYINPLPKRR